MPFAFKIDPGVEVALASFLPPPDLGFAQIHAPVMFEAEYVQGEWREGRLLPFGPIPILPNARGLQFGEAVFEGMKAFRVPGAAPHLFRPRRHWRRMTASAARIGIPAIPQELFFGGIAASVTSCADIIPTGGSASLYLRPFVLVMDAGYTVGNSANYKFMVLASPSGPYVSGDLRAMIERNDVRAARGGHRHRQDARQLCRRHARDERRRAGRLLHRALARFNQPPEHRGVLRDEPGRSDRWHPAHARAQRVDPCGITRDSIIALARRDGMQVTEREIPIDELMAAITDASCTEVFATGTAAMVASVAEIGDADGRRYALREDRIARGLRAGILAIQNRARVDPFGWTVDLSTIRSDVGSWAQ